MIKTLYKNLYQTEQNGVLIYKALIKHNGRQFKKTFTAGLTLKQALNRLDIFREAIINGKPQKKRITLNALCNEYLEHIKVGQSEQTVRTKRGFYNNHIAPKFGTKYIDNIHYKDYQKLVNNLLSANVGLSPKTVTNIKDLLRTMYKLAIKLEYIDKNPLIDIEIPRYDNTRNFYMTEEKIKELFQTIIKFDETLYRGIFTFLLEGRRLNEVLSLTWDMLDLERGSYLIPHQINKAKKDMRYIISKHLLPILKDQHLEQLETYHHVSGYVFKSPRTGQKVKDVRKAWKRILNKANIEHMRIHDIRHLIGYYATNILEMPVEKVSATLGHSSFEVTQKYINVKPESANEVIEGMYESLG
jgi:integrase